jgi:hypothetical protein
MVVSRFKRAKFRQRGGFNLSIGQHECTFAPIRRHGFGPRAYVNIDSIHFRESTTSRTSEACPDLTLSWGTANPIDNVQRNDWLAYVLKCSLFQVVELRRITLFIQLHAPLSLKATSQNVAESGNSSKLVQICFLRPEAFLRLFKILRSALLLLSSTSEHQP